MRTLALRGTARDRSMPPALLSAWTYGPYAETLLIALAGGVGFTMIGFPAGLVTGSMLAVALAALMGRPMQVPLWLARICFVIIGMLLGAVVTPQTLAGVTHWPLSIAVLGVSSAVMLVVVTLYLRFVH